MKTAYVSLTYLIRLEPAEVGISDDCSQEQFEAAVEGYVHRVVEELYDGSNMVPNDIEMDFKGF